MSLWLVVIILHTLAALVCFITGLYILSPDKARRRVWCVYVFLGSSVGLLVFMIGAILSHWNEISNVEKIVFSGLSGLGIYIIYRSIKAYALLHKDRSESKYVDHIGFVLISLFNGFTIVALIDLDFPGWTVVLGAVIATIVGSRLVGRVKYRFS